MLKYSPIRQYWLCFAEVKNTARLFKIISKTLSISAVFTVVLLAVLLVGTKLIGLTPYTVLSGSMEPAYHVGSVVYVAKADANELRENDCITYYMSNGSVVTHRIIEVKKAENGEISFRTKGDANKLPDGYQPASAIIGKVVFSIPYLGYLSDFVQKPLGLIAIVGSCIAVFIISLVIDWIFSEEKAKANDSEVRDEEQAEQA